MPVPSQPMPPQPDYPEEFKKWQAIVEGPFAGSKYTQLGSCQEFKDLRDELAPRAMKPCSALSCPHGVRDYDKFSKHATNKTDGLQQYCKYCEHGDGGRARLEASNKRKQEVTLRQAEAPEVKSSGDVEDEAVKYLVPKLQEWLEDGFRVVIMGEFRRADVAVYVAKYGKWVGIQFKTSAGKQTKGHNQYGLAGFADCHAHDGKGYLNMIMVFVKTWGEDKKRTFWLEEYNTLKAKLPASGHLAENKDGILGPDSVALEPWDDEEAFVEHLGHYIERTPVEQMYSWSHLFFDMRHHNQKTELALMLVDSLWNAVEFPTGFQGRFDMLRGDDKRKTQVKTMNKSTGMVHSSGKDKGMGHQPYRETDGIDDFLVGRLAKPASDTYYYVHAAHSRETWRDNGILTYQDDEGNWHGGQTHFTMRMSPKIRQMIGAPEEPKRLQEKTRWTADAANELQVKEFTKQDIYENLKVFGVPEGCTMTDEEMQKYRECAVQLIDDVASGKFDEEGQDKKRKRDADGAGSYAEGV